MRNPDPNVMRKIFNDSEALEKLSDIMSRKLPNDDRTITVGGESYTVRRSSDKKPRN